ncbi:MAG TPA: energy transducer TonB [Candidatus Dormibacteraeota bacterium]|jgi:protein TonB|nr:energy transducer TonB [Candidatus Dormibacteraeota bacterium]
MGDSLSVRQRKSFQNTNEESWLERVKQNARAFFELRGTTSLAHASVGAFDLLKEKPAPGTRRRQAASVLVHVVAIGVVLVLGRQAVEKLPPVNEILTKRGPLLSWKPDAPRTEKPGGKEGSGGYLGEKPPTSGDFAARSQMVLLHPRVPDQQEHILPVEPKVFDANANDLQHVPQIGLPSMKDRNDSNGPGKNGGMGFNGPGNSMGNGLDDGEGESNESGTPRHGTYSVKCIYCPDPEYTEEARKAKMQGSVTLEVFVRADGRVGRVKIVKGIGLGLDERAMDAVRAWRFEPARDASRRPIGEWVTVETTYRLF